MLGLAWCYFFFLAHFIFYWQKASSVAGSASWDVAQLTLVSPERFRWISWNSVFGTDPTLTMVLWRPHMASSLFPLSDEQDTRPFFPQTGLWICCRVSQGVRKLTSSWLGCSEAVACTSRLCAVCMLPSRFPALCVLQAQWEDLRSTHWYYVIPSTPFDDLQFTCQDKLSDLSTISVILSGNVPEISVILVSE